MKNIIYLCLLIVLSLFSCNTGKLVEKRNVFFQFMEKEIVYDTSFTKSYGEKKNVAIHFYSLNNNNYFYIYSVSGFSNKLKGFIETKDYILFYYGIDDVLASKYLNINKPDFYYLGNKYLNLDKSIVDIWKNQIQYYKIIQDTVFIKFSPDAKHELELENLLYEVGFHVLPPPPPIE